MNEEMKVSSVEECDAKEQGNDTRQAVARPIPPVRQQLDVTVASYWLNLMQFIHIQTASVKTERLHSFCASVPA